MPIFNPFSFGQQQVSATAPAAINPFQPPQAGRQGSIPELLAGLGLIALRNERPGSPAVQAAQAVFQNAEAQREFERRSALEAQQQSAANARQERGIQAQFGLAGFEADAQQARDERLFRQQLENPLNQLEEEQRRFELGEAQATAPLRREASRLGVQQTRQQVEAFPETQELQRRNIQSQIADREQRGSLAQSEFGLQERRQNLAERRQDLDERIAEINRQQSQDELALRKQDIALRFTQALQGQGVDYNKAITGTRSLFGTASELALNDLKAQGLSIEDFALITRPDGTVDYLFNDPDSQKQFNRLLSDRLTEFNKIIADPTYSSFLSAIAAQDDPNDVTADDIEDLGNGKFRNKKTGEVGRLGGQ